MSEKITDKDLQKRILTLTPFPGIPMGTIMPVIHPACIPKGWLLCDGKKINSKYADLIQLIGDYAPNLTARVLMGGGKNPQDENSDGSSASLNPRYELPFRFYGGYFCYENPTYTIKAGENSWWGNTEIKVNNTPEIYVLPAFYTVCYIVYTGLIE